MVGITIFVVRYVWIVYELCTLFKADPEFSQSDEEVAGPQRRGLRRMICKDYTTCMIYMLVC